MLPYIMYGAVIFLAILITLFACFRWIFVTANWQPVAATIEGTHFVGSVEERRLLVDVAYIFDEMLYRGSVDASSHYPHDYVAGSTMMVLVNPKRPALFNRDRNYRFQKTKIAKWLACKLARTNHHS